MGLRVARLQLRESLGMPRVTAAAQARLRHLFRHKAGSSPTKYGRMRPVAAAIALGACSIPSTQERGERISFHTTLLRVHTNTNTPLTPPAGFMQSPRRGRTHGIPWP